MATVLGHPVANRKVLPAGKVARFEHHAGGQILGARCAEADGSNIGCRSPSRLRQQADCASHSDGSIFGPIRYLSWLRMKGDQTTGRESVGDQALPAVKGEDPFEKAAPQTGIVDLPAVEALAKLGVSDDVRGDDLNAGEE